MHSRARYRCKANNMTSPVFEHIKFSMLASISHSNQRKTARFCMYILGLEFMTVLLFLSHILTGFRYGAFRSDLANAVPQLWSSAVRETAGQADRQAEERLRHSSLQITYIFPL